MKAELLLKPLSPGMDHWSLTFYLQLDCYLCTSWSVYSLSIESSVGLRRNVLLYKYLLVMNIIVHWDHCSFCSIMNQRYLVLTGCISASNLLIIVGKVNPHLTICICCFALVSGKQMSWIQDICGTPLISYALWGTGYCVITGVFFILVGKLNCYNVALVP